MEAEEDIQMLAKRDITQDSGRKMIVASGDNTEISANKELDLYGKEQLIGYSDKRVDVGAKENIHVYGGKSLISAKDKIEYKAPQMNKLPQSGEFEYTKEKRVVTIFWTYGKDFQPLSDKSRFYTDMNLHVQTRNYEVGEKLNVTIKSDDGSPIAKDIQEINLSGTVEDGGVVLFKEVLKNYTLNLTHETENSADNPNYGKYEDEKNRKYEEYKKWEQQQWEIYQKDKK